MNYKDMLESGEKLIFVTRLHLYIMIYPIVFCGVFGLTFTYGGWLTGEFELFCNIMTYAMLLYPLTITIMIIQSRYVVTDKRVIEQTGIVAKRFRTIPIEDIIDVASHQTNFRKKIRCGDVRIKFKNGKQTDYRVFGYLFKPHEFIVHIQDLIEK